MFGLENEIITPDDSFALWDNTEYPFEEWNKDQTLQSAMQYSVNWYFQGIDDRLGSDTIHKYIHRIKYGNENINTDLTSYWLESSLKISPIEQVELLTSLYKNDWNFSPENVDTVKNSIHIASSEYGEFYGKTGTGRINGADINGWFVGYIESAGRTYFLATNIGADADATGSRATEITMSILSDMNIWSSKK